jgi:DNA polymerase I-like protein with 3'-5' exonuclease and polymerase domains
MVDETVLKKIKGIPEALLIAEYLTLQKRIAQIKSWLKNIDDEDRVHGFVNTNGTITGRMTHREPNLAQVPNSNSPYGTECRACWTVPDDYKLVGIDASGLELRMLAHYMDDEGFTNEILHGDIHTANQKLAGLESRSQAKTFIYAFIYGAGDEKLGTVVGGGRADGQRLKQSFLDNLPSLRNLKNRVTRAAAKGHIKGLDGRKIYIRSAHAALNSLLQGGGSIVMKEALCLLNGYIQDNNLDAHFVANIHDEWQIEVLEKDAKKVGELGILAIQNAGLEFDMKCPLDGEYNIGANWSETH